MLKIILHQNQLCSDAWPKSLIAAGGLLSFTLTLLCPWRLESNDARIPKVLFLFAVRGVCQGELGTSQMSLSAKF